MKVHLARIRLDDTLHDRMTGLYHGLGAPVWRVWRNATQTICYVRALSRTGAISAACEKHGFTPADFYRLR
jgi:hypothetical protein